MGKAKLEQRCKELIASNFDMVFAEDPDLKRIVIIGELKILTEKKFDKLNLATMAQVREELEQRLFDYIFADLLKEIKDNE